MEDARDAEALVFGREAEGRQFALRAGDEDAIADLRADLLSEVFAEDQRRIGRCRLVAQRGPVGIERIFWRGGWRRLGVEIFCRAGNDGVEEVADGALFGRDDAFDQRETGTRPTRDQYLTVESRRGCGDVG